MNYIAILGRQPEIGLAEIKAWFPTAKKIAPQVAYFSSDTRPNLDRFGGVLKMAERLDGNVEKYLAALPEGKIVFGVSDYSRDAREFLVKKQALRIKNALKHHGRSARVLLPDKNQTTISTATAHHNQLGEKPTHVELITINNAWYIGIGVQNITAYAKRDQARPARDAKVGMLPPKLAQILINLCGPLPEGARILDPFCGTGVVLQEAARMGYKVYGTDKSERMIEYTEKNLKWAGATDIATLSAGDATDFQWSAPIDAVAAETYLGPPMSKPPVSIKLKEVEQECAAIIRGFLRNLAGQIESGTPVAIAVPAWLVEEGSNRYHRLKLLDEVDSLGYNVYNNDLSQAGLLYFRPGQVVAREIIVLRKK